MSGAVLDGRKAMVTGGAKGLGEGIARAFAGAGAAVVIADVLGRGGSGDRRLDQGQRRQRVLREARRHRRRGLGDRRRQGRRRHGRPRRPGQQRRRRDHRADHRHRRRRRCARCSTSTSSAPRSASSTPSAPCARRDRRQRRRDRQRRLGGGHDRVPRHRRLLRHQVGGRPDDPGRGHGVRQARLRRPGQLHLPRARAHRDGHEAWPATWPSSACSPSPEAAVGRRHRAHAARAGSARSPTWRTRWCSWPPTPPGSSPASACPSTAEWGCEHRTCTDKPVVVYGASGYTGRLDLRVPARVQRPLRRRRPRQGPRPGGDLHGPRHRDRRARGRRRSSTRRGAHRAVHRRPGRLQHGRPVHQVRPRGGRGLPGRRHALPRHDRRAGLGDRMRARTGASEFADEGPAALPRHRADVHDRRDRGPDLPGDTRAWTPSTSRCFWGASRPSPRPRRSSPILNADWYYLEQNQYVPLDPDGGTTRSSVPGQHELGARAALGRHQSHPVWFKNDPRVANCRVIGGVLQPHA